MERPGIRLFGVRLELFALAAVGLIGGCESLKDGFRERIVPVTDYQQPAIGPGYYPLPPQYPYPSPPVVYLPPLFSNPPNYFQTYQGSKTEITRTPGGGTTVRGKPCGLFRGC